MDVNVDDVFEGELELAVLDVEYFKVEGDSDTRKKYDEI